MLYYQNEHLVNCAGLDTLKSFPVDIEVLKDGINIQEKGDVKPFYWPVYQYENTGDIIATISDDIVKAIATTAKKAVDVMNDTEINNVNSMLLSGDVKNARMRKFFRYHITQYAENENLYTVSISAKIIDNDLSSDCFTCALLKTDVNEVVEALEKLVQKTLSGKKFEAILQHCYNDLHLTETNTINRNRRVFIEGYYKTVHDTKNDCFTRKLAKKDLPGLYSAILASDEVIARDRDEIIAKQKEEKKFRSK